MEKPMGTAVAALDKSGSKLGVVTPGSIRLKKSGLYDIAFLMSVYADSRFEEMQQISHWNAVEKNEFLHFQFNAQAAHYKEHYPTAEYLVIEQENKAIGRLYIERKHNDICIMDIAILREHRRKGIAKKLISDVLNEAKQTNAKVNLHVEPNNIAKKLYLSLGFVVVGEVSFYEKMEWCAQ
jgi:ribosomal protein S18 acetylase RimI-like enzyme